MDCKYHFVCVPKYRKKVLYRQIHKFLGPLFHHFMGSCFL
ncbi:transposase [Fluoribacter dumoffii]|nr:transposase [Fluoribacter dumoffii]MCW8454009.1 transposase [Fluoribacter dumoffii]MCW8496609.1 transposase [Fluoribacter dumoffii]